MKTAVELIVLGLGGNALDLAETALLPGSGFRLIGFLDDDESRRRETLLGVPVLGRLSDADRFPEAAFINGIGSPRSFSRKEGLIDRTDIERSRWATLVHPSAVVSTHARLGHGVGVLPMVTINHGATIEDHVILLPGTVVAHDAVIGAYSCIAGGVGVSGGARVGRGCYIGSHAVIRDGVVVGDGALVGMGSVVIRDVPAGEVWAGNPARPLAPRGPNTSS